MISPWVHLEEHDHIAFRALIAFLNKRLVEPGAIDWALRLKRTQRVERIAVVHLLNTPDERVLDEPWATAWRLIEESWSGSWIEEDSLTAIYGIQARLRAGDRSGAIVAAIVKLVAPRLNVKPIDSWRWQFFKKPRRPKTFDRLLSASLTSGDLVDLNVLQLDALSEIPFLTALANALEAAINHGLDIAYRLGWDGQQWSWHLGELGRAYYESDGSQTKGSRDPDADHVGIAPAVKLLHAVVARITDLEINAAQPFIHRWRLANSPVHIRLWSAAARNPLWVTDQEVGAFLLGLDNREFWDFHEFPEIAELRALRFGGLDQDVRKAMVTRLRQGPPRDHWPKRANAEKVKKDRLYWAVRELKRIVVAGCALPPDAQSWLEVRIRQFADLATMTIKDGFFKASELSEVPPNPDAGYNTLEGVIRLRALETALSTSPGGWHDDPAQRAKDWLRQPENTARVLGDLVAVGNGGGEFPRLWNRFGWEHSPKQPETAETPQQNLQDEAVRVLKLLQTLSEKTLSVAIEGISHWLKAWREQIFASHLGLPVWMRVWPIAVDATNAKPPKEDDAELSVFVRADEDDREPMDLDTYESPAGKLVSVFLAGCPTLAQEPTPFAAGTNARQMLDAVIVASGRSGLIVRHRLIEALPYFLCADSAWAKESLIAPLQNDDGASFALWRAMARRTHYTEVLKIIGEVMAERATDRRLGRETRQKLVFSLIIESLHAFRENREPAVPNPRIQQMLRTLDDEVRAAAANAIQQFVRELSKKNTHNEEPLSAAALYRSTAAPFLRDVWPQERSLATPGVSSALSDLPATSGEAFAEAVAAIERFLVPFECWSMVNYGLHGDEGDTKKLAIINDETKARALLRLLDLTVGRSEGAVIPHGLTDALDQIQSRAPKLVDSPEFRRLSTAARR